MYIYESDNFEPPTSMVAAWGRRVLLTLRNAGRAFFILGEGMMYIPMALRRRQEVARQLFDTGVRNFGVVSIVALFTGMILSLQAGLVFKEYGQASEVGGLVSQTMLREMGAFMTALILAASVGAGIAAELGTMSVSEEISALHVMSINPAEFLVMPRLLGLMIMCPVLTVYANVVGTLGGMLVAYTQLGVSPTAYTRSAMDFLDYDELYIGVIKAVVFGIAVAGVACYNGLTARGGALGVGQATRRTVVHSFLLVLVVGYFLTRFMLD